MCFSISACICGRAGNVVIRDCITLCEQSVELHVAQWYTSSGGEISNVTDLLNEEKRLTRRVNFALRASKRFLLNHAKRPLVSQLTELVTSS